MAQFEREDRYWVFKRKHFNRMSIEGQQNLLNAIGEYNMVLDNHGIANPKMVIVEEDWPEYEVVWSMIQRRMTGTHVEHLDPTTLVVFMVDTPELAPHYDKAFVPLDMTACVVVGNGTVCGNPTVDFQLTDAGGTQYVAMLTGALVDTLTRAVNAYKLK